MCIGPWLTIVFVREKPLLLRTIKCLILMLVIPRPDWILIPDTGVVQGSACPRPAWGKRGCLLGWKVCRDFVHHCETCLYESSRFSGHSPIGCHEALGATRGTGYRTCKLRTALETVLRGCTVQLTFRWMDLTKGGRNKKVSYWRASWLEIGLHYQVQNYFTS